jgi:iron complex transport system ATP-binding protein
MMLSARDITVRAGRAELLRNVSIEAVPGEVVGLIGPNGAGKSTLMRVLAGVKAPDQGTVLYDGHRGPFGAPDLPGAQAIEQSLAATDLIDLRQRAVTTLSGGELARALLARALSVGGDALLADEPVAALDPCHQLEVMAILRQRADAGGTVAVVLHDLALAARFCDRLVLLHQGCIAAQGTPDEVLSDALLAQVYRVRALRLQPPGTGAAAVLPWQLLPSTNQLQEPHP